ncbi:hypothetical protein [Thermaerobacter subterraneus]|uniref:ECF transporter S component n=1 Tax=Thermaerobacter subterraneus DSM 13965 TaxID=867903 RepID=K6Q2H8_9FIRM|nr:hypothetical protein [Thermaerobacter subterraneus]EKP95413.1 hypothetical protein ThesuDRAFT_01165 [Thermaerobacter subterraneus DSM 13965]
MPARTSPQASPAATAPVARQVVLGGLLTALALMIPIFFRGTLQLTLGPYYTATLASHVPPMLAMTLGPGVAVMVGLGATAGFFLTLGPVVAARAFVHVPFAVLGAWAQRRGWPLWAALLLTLPVHAAGEGLVVWLASGTALQAWLTSGGTAVHHLIDGALTLAVLRLLQRAGIRLEAVGR